ncbi:monovalent cation/H+ antiporter subunit D [Cypionkella aquatica]|uniref:Monovalent cation/H+ antiporter subunit D n=1 Tax=Cypionkella aquatica TaxID=1756042 RepID=A0AA37X0H6_9RHOB|nr:monovalent cation/H+ antiporter subunit D [Cypionkella aquatica]GLS85790.1 monovalent cation/H+ antiporter subunit D [Cypionkella aquatica]
MSQLLILPVVLPAVLAGVIILFAGKTLAVQRGISVLGTLALLALAITLIQAPTQAYFLGNWPAPFGIVLMLDGLSALMLLLTASLALIILIHTIRTGWDAKGRHFHALYLFQLMGLNGAFLTGDAFNLFVFFEVLLIASYGLMVHGGGQARIRVGVQYVAFNLLGSTLFLFALATIYSTTGTLNMADLALKLPQIPAEDSALIRVAAVLLMLVFAIKAALVPLQFWLPGTYANAPGPVAALFAVMTKVGAYALIRFGTLVFPTDLPATTTLLANLIYPAALATIAVGAFGTLASRNLPRQIAFAAIGSMGTLLLAVSAFTPPATSAALYYLIHSTLATAALFLISDLARTRRDGLTAALFMIAVIAMAGMPPLSGFVGKLLILDALRTDPLAWAAILLASLLTMIGFARAGSDLFWKSPDTEAPAQSQAAVLLCLTALIALTLAAGPVTTALDQTAQALHNPTAYIAANQLGGR